MAVRADRLRLLREGDHRFLALIEESVLGNMIGGAEVMAASSATCPPLSLPAPCRRPVLLSQGVILRAVRDKDLNDAERVAFL